MSLRALVPIKDFGRAKSRLAGVLDADGRARLAQRLARHVLETLRASAHIDEVVVVTPASDVRALADMLGVRVLADDVDAPGLAAVVDAARHALGGDAHLVVMSDLPGLTVEDVAALVDARSRADVVIGADARGLGTNAVVLPASMASCFGHEDSALRHEASATSRGLRVVRVMREGIAHDIDLPEHLGATEP